VFGPRGGDDPGPLGLEPLDPGRRRRRVFTLAEPLLEFGDLFSDLDDVGVLVGQGRFEPDELHPQVPEALPGVGRGPAVAGGNGDRGVDQGDLALQADLLLLEGKDAAVEAVDVGVDLVQFALQQALEARRPLPRVLQGLLHVQG